MSSKQALADMDERIRAGLDHVGLVDELVIGTRAIAGYYNEQFLAGGEGESAVPGYRRTFDCAAADLPAGLEQDDEVTVTDYGDFRYLRRERGGPGRAILVLGDLLP